MTLFNMSRRVMFEVEDTLSQRIALGLMLQVNTLTPFYPPLTPF